MTKTIGQLRVDGSGYQIRAKAGGAAELFIYDEISEWGISAKQIATDLKEIGPVDMIVVRINSAGGNVFDGLAIHNLLKSHAARVEVYIDGVAASIASVIAMAGDEIVIAENAFMMIHNPLGSIMWGDSDDLREMAEVLDKLMGSIRDTYVSRTGLTDKKVKSLMAEETWLDANEVIDLGFADRMAKPLKVAASIDPSRLRGFASVPDSFSQQVQSEETPNMAATYQDLKAALPEADAAFLCAQLDAGAEVDTAKTAFTTHQVATAKAAAAQAKAEAEKQLAAIKIDLKQAQAKAKAAEDKADALAKAPGVDPVGDGKGKTEPTGEGREGFWAKVAEKTKAGTPKAKAISAVCREEPDLHKAMLDEHNAEYGRKNLARE